MMMPGSGRVEAGKKLHTVGFLGPKGTYSQEAAINLFGPAANLQAYASIDAAIRAVASGEIGECVAPIENSLEGSVNVTLDTLAHEVELFITREIVMPVRHNLLARGHDRKVRLILSHPQALAQCRRTLSRLYPGAEVRAVESTAEAARRTAAEEEGVAAVGGRSAAEIYGLDIIAADIQDTVHNCTRFITLNLHQTIETAKHWKTSIVIQIDGSKPGALYAILAEFAGRDVNLTKIESRPARTGLGNYLFFLDFEGSAAEPQVKEALIEVEKRSVWFKSLGSYPVLAWER